MACIFVFVLIFDLEALPVARKRQERYAPHGDNQELFA
jgi:hypothetical protein